MIWPEACGTARFRVAAKEGAGPRDPRSAWRCPTERADRPGGLSYYCYDESMRRLFLLCGLVPLTAVASEHWIRFTSGPIEVFSSAGSKDGRDTLVKFEEFRHALGQVLGDNDLQLPLPIRVLLF
jgi:hypothetical protein